MPLKETEFLAGPKSFCANLTKVNRSLPPENNKTGFSNWRSLISKNIK